VLEPVVARYRGKVSRLYFRADAAFANPEVYEFLEAEGFKYAIRLPANSVLQESIGYLLKRPVGRPPIEVRRYHTSFSYRAQSWMMPRRVVAKVEWHPGELYPRVGFVVTNLSRPAERVVAFYNQRGTAEQWIKEGKNAINWTRLSCRLFTANAVRLQLHALAYNLGNFLRTLATPRANQELVPDQPEGEANQDRRQGRQPRQLYRIPDGGSRHPKRPLCRYPAPDRGTAVAA
jgi:Transposase DDE domain group 1